MNDRRHGELPFDSEDPSERKLWAALKDLPRSEPSPALRRGFYGRLEAIGSRGFGHRIRTWLGLTGNAGWVTAAACTVLGFGLAALILPHATPTTAVTDDGRLAALEDNVAMLNRELILNRLQADSASIRLQGVMDAGARLGDDPALAQALLARASNDRSPSVRSAAIDALGPQVARDDVGDELMRLLRQTDSPIVQLALVNLVLRHGNAAQLRTLSQLAVDGKLHPDLVPHVRQALPGANA